MTDEASDRNDIDDEIVEHLKDIEDPVVPADGTSPVPTLAAGNHEEEHLTGERQAAENRENDPPA